MKQVQILSYCYLLVKRYHKVKFLIMVGAENNLERKVKLSPIRRTYTIIGHTQHIHIYRSSINNSSIHNIRTVVNERKLIYTNIKRVIK